MQAAGDLGGGQILECGVVQLREALGFDVGGQPAREILERSPPPQSERITQRVRRAGRRAVGHRGLGRTHLGFEAMRVDHCAGRDAVSVTDGLDRARAEHLAQAKDVVLQRLRRRLRRTFAPDGVDQAIGFDRGTAAERERGKDGAFSAGPWPLDTSPVFELNRTKDPEFHAANGTPTCGLTALRTRVDRGETAVVEGRAHRNPTARAEVRT